MDKILEIPELMTEIVQEQDRGVRAQLAGHVLELIKEGTQAMFIEREVMLNKFITQLEAIKEKNDN